MTDTAHERARAEQQLREAGASTAYEAAGRTGALPPSIARITGAGVLVGRALTVECSPGDNLAIHLAIAAAQPSEILVIAGHGAHVGYIGEVLATAAQHRGIAGAVVDGGVRDIDAITILGFPIWATARCIRSASKIAPGRLRAPVRFGHVEVSTGDVIVADGDGVVAVSAAEAVGAAARAAERAAWESRALADLRTGVTTVELFGLPTSRVSS